MDKWTNKDYARCRRHEVSQSASTSRDECWMGAALAEECNVVPCTSGRDAKAQSSPMLWRPMPWDDPNQTITDAVIHAPHPENLGGIRGSKTTANPKPIWN